MATPKGPCDQAIRDALGRDVSAEELQRIKQYAARLKRKMDAAKNDPLAVEAIMGTFENDTALRRAAERRATAFNYMKNRKLLSWWRNSVPKAEPGEGLKAIMTGSLLDFHGSKNSLSALMGRESAERPVAFVSDALNAKVDVLLRDRAATPDIMRAMWAINQGEPLAALAAKYGKPAADAASVAVKHLENGRTGRNMEGAMIPRNPKFIVRRQLDVHKLAKAGGVKWGEGFAAWKARAERMNWKESFDGEYADAPAAEREALLQSVYNQYLSGRHVNFSGEPAGRGPPGLGRRHSFEREIVFDAVEDEVAYLMDFAKGDNLSEMIWHTLENDGRDIAMMRMFGTNPLEGWRRFTDEIAKSVTDDLSAASKFQKQRERIEKTIWPAYLGDMGHPNANFGAQAMMVARGSVGIVARLGMAALAGLVGDPIKRAIRNQRYFNEHFAPTFGRYVSDLVVLARKVPKEQMYSMARAAGILVKDIHLPLHYSPEAEFGLGRLARLIKYSNYAGGHNLVDNRFRFNWYKKDAHQFAEISKTDYAHLPKGTRAELQQFAITGREWAAMRRVPKSEIDGLTSLQPTDIRGAPLEMFKPLVDDPKPSERQLMRAREDLADKFRNIMGERAVGASSDLDYATRAMMLQGQRGDTFFGQVWRSALQFKTWPTKYTRETLGGALWGFGQVKDSVPSAIWRTISGKNNGGARMLAATVSLGMFGGAIWVLLTDLLKGRVPDDVTDTKYLQGLAMRAFAFQALGLLTDFVADEFRRGGGDMRIQDRIFNMLGPGVENLADLVEIMDPADMVAGRFDWNKKAADAFNLIWKNTPGLNLPFSYAAMRALVYDNVLETLRPGHKRRAARRLREHGMAPLIQ